MSQWSNSHPEQMEEIARLPLNQQTAALRDAIGYDPNAVRDRLEEKNHCHRDLSKASPGEAQSPPQVRSASPGGGPSYCPACGAPKDAPCAPWCEARRGV